MKNRRIVVVALMLVAVICVGVGYAALQDEITFTGKVNYTPDFQIVWGAVTDTSSILTETGTPGSDTITVSMNTTSWDVGEDKTFTVAVENNSRYAAENVQVKTINVDALAGNYTVTAVPAANTIAVGGTTTVTVTVTMINYPEDTVTDAPFTFQVYAEQGASAQN